MELSTKANLRDYSWKRLFRLPADFSKNTEVEDWRTKIYLVKQVFDDPRFEINRLEDSLKDIVDSFAETDWRTDFIRIPKLLDYLEQGFIQWISENEIYLYKNSQRNHLHRELQSYILYLSYREQNIDYGPFKDYDHKEARGTDDYSGIVFHDYPYKASTYNLRIRYFPHEGFYRFYFAKVNNQPIKAAKVIDALSQIKFEPAEDNCYVRKVKKESVNNLLKKVKNALSEIGSAVELA